MKDKREKPVSVAILETEHAQISTECSQYKIVSMNEKTLQIILVKMASLTINIEQGCVLVINLGFKRFRVNITSELLRRVLLRLEL